MRSNVASLLQTTHWLAQYLEFFLTTTFLRRKRFRRRPHLHLSRFLPAITEVVRSDLVSYGSDKKAGHAVIAVIAQYVSMDFCTMLHDVGQVLTDSTRGSVTWRVPQYQNGHFIQSPFFSALGAKWRFLIQSFDNIADTSCIQLVLWKIGSLSSTIVHFEFGIRQKGDVELFVFSGEKEIKRDDTVIGRVDMPANWRRFASGGVLSVFCRLQERGAPRRPSATPGNDTSIQIVSAKTAPKFLKSGLCKVSQDSVNRPSRSRNSPRNDTIIQSDDFLEKFFNFPFGKISQVCTDGPSKSSNSPRNDTSIQKLSANTAPKFFKSGLCKVPRYSVNGPSGSSNSPRNDTGIHIVSAKTAPKIFKTGLRNVCQACGDGPSRSSNLPRKDTCTRTEDFSQVFQDCVYGPSKSCNSPSVHKLRENLKELLLSEEACDVTLKVQNQEFKAHKALLIARSSVFKAMFRHEMSEKLSNEVHITDCDPEAFRIFLKHVYTGDTEGLSVSNAFNVFSVANKYDATELKIQSKDCIARNITVETVCDVVAFSLLHNDSVLLEMASEYFTKHFSPILLTNKWQCFFREHATVANELLIRASKFHVPPK